MNRDQLSARKISWNVSRNYYWAMQYRYLGLHSSKENPDKHLITLVNYIVKVYSPIIMVWDKVKTVMCRWKSSSLPYDLSTEMKIVIVISEFIKRHSKAKRIRAPAPTNQRCFPKGIVCGRLKIVTEVCAAAFEPQRDGFIRARIASRSAMKVFNKSQIFV